VINPEQPAVLALGCAESGESAADASRARQTIPERSGPAAAPSPPKPQKSSCYATAHVRGAATLHRKPGGKAWMRVAARTEWDSPRVLGVVRRHGGWLGVQAPELRNGEVGWLRPRKARLGCTAWSVHADLSRRKVVVRREGRTVRTMAVGIGRPASPTPTGRFSVTDKLRWNDGFILRLLRACPQRTPDETAGGLARRGSPCRSRQSGRRECGRCGEPRVSARDLAPGALADRDHSARRARVRTLLISRPEWY
jgi:hypothetical protein